MPDFDRTSRLAIRWIEAGSNEVFFDPATLIRELAIAGSPKQQHQRLKHSIHVISGEWRLFYWDRQRECYRRRYRPGEISHGREIIADEFNIPRFKLRVQRRINVRVAMACILVDITRSGDRPAPHSRADFARQLQCDAALIRRYLMEQSVHHGHVLDGVCES
jgi:hypothetical protein